MPVSLKWYASNVKTVIRKQTAEGLDRVALRVRSQARRNITANGQIDTKFLWNSVYVATPEKHTEVPASGEYVSLKDGKAATREATDIVLPTEGAFVGVAAAYGVYVELQQSFLFSAIQTVQGKEAEEAMAGLQTTLIEE